MERRIRNSVTVARGKFTAGEESRLAEVATEKELAHLTKVGAIEGFVSGDPEALSGLGATARHASPAGHDNEANNPAVSSGTPGTGPNPPAEEGEPGLEDMSRAQLISRAESLGINVEEVEGTGKDGYVTMPDLIRAIESKEAEREPT